MTFIKFAIFYECPKTITISKIIITNAIIMKILRYCKNNQNVTQRLNGSNYWKNGTNSPCSTQTCHKASTSKTCIIYETKQNKTKQNMPV